MSNDQLPPFRADHVGSLLRPRFLLDARARCEKGELSSAQLRRAEDAAIEAAVARQQELGLRSITDGEFRRRFFHVDFLQRLAGVVVRGALPIRFRTAEGEQEFAPPTMEVVGRLERKGPMVVDDFTFLRERVRATAKLCIPSPSMLHFRGGRRGVSSEIYPRIDDFFEDLSRAYRQEISALAAAGCRYLQLDDTNLAYLCDPAMRERTRQIGEDPQALPRVYAGLINAAIEPRPPGMTICIHLCRGNFRSGWVAEGGYEPVAEVLFGELRVDGYFLEYDDERSGDFTPLRFVRPGQRVVLGLVSSKRPALEAPDELRRRIDEASRQVPLEQLAISPQCGFSSTSEGNRISEDDQFRKLALVVETARKVWGTS